jgi:hypothetical protein
MVAYAQNTNIDTIDLVADIMVIPGLLLGAMLPFWFSSMTMSAVGRAAMAIVEEVRRQFKEIDGLLEGRPGVEADHQRCVDISTRAALREMIYPALLPMVSVIVVGLLLGAKALAALIAGAIITSFMLAVTMANAGGAWDNAKKYVESGAFGAGHMKGSDLHKAVVIGDTVGDPFKDTSGPALNIMIKMMSVLSLLLSPLFGQPWPFQAPHYWAGIIILGVAVIVVIIFTIVAARRRKAEAAAALAKDGSDDIEMNPVHPHPHSQPVVDEKRHLVAVTPAPVSPAPGAGSESAAESVSGEPAVAAAPAEPTAV